VSAAPRHALVLSGGGARAAYQVGVLCAIAERAPHFNFPIITGVSAGAINAAHVAAYQGSFAAATLDLREHWSRLVVHSVYRLRPPGVWRAMVRTVRRFVQPGVDQALVRGLLDLAPLRNFLGGRLPHDGIARNIAGGRIRAAALSATSYGTGRVVTFVEGSAEIELWERSQREARRSVLTLDHILASSAIPLLFPAITIEGEFFADGSVRQTAPLSPAIHLGADAILAIGMRSSRPAAHPPGELREYPTTAAAMGLLFHAVFMDSLQADSERLAQINAVLGAAGGGSSGLAAMRPVRLLLLQPSQDLGAMARGHDALLPPFIRLAVRAIGGARSNAADFLSYLLFDPAYTDRLVGLGYEDTLQQWPRIEAFLAG
jgi:NTE family protein